MFPPHADFDHELWGKKLESEDENTAPHDDMDKPKPEDDAYLSESGRILLDYLGLSSAMAKH